MALVQGCSSSSLQRSIVFFVCFGAVPTSVEKSGILDFKIQPPPWHIFEGALLPQRPLGIHLPKTQSRNLNVLCQLNAAFLNFILSVLLQPTNCEMGLPVRILMILYINQAVDGTRSGVNTKTLRWRVECA